MTLFDGLFANYLYNILSLMPPYINYYIHAKCQLVTHINE